MHAIRSQWQSIAGDASAGTLVVRGARWGVEGSWVDVTDRVRAAQDTLSLLDVSPLLLGDPFVGRSKSLVIDLTVEGVCQQLVVGENLSFIQLIVGGRSEAQSGARDERREIR
jgi:hypothetical protein